MHLRFLTVSQKRSPRRLSTRSKLRPSPRRPPSPRLQSLRPTLRSHPCKFYSAFLFVSASGVCRYFPQTILLCGFLPLLNFSTAYRAFALPFSLAETQSEPTSQTGPVAPVPLPPAPAADVAESTTTVALPRDSSLSSDCVNLSPL